MSLLMERVVEIAAGCGEEALKAIRIDPLIVESGAARRVAPYLRETGHTRVLLAADDRTFEAAGRLLVSSIRGAGIHAEATMIKPDAQGDVIADEASIVQLLLDIQKYQSQAVIAVGSGTIHDISRYAAYTAGIPFVSVPTAPSVDGFNSKGAPIIVRGEKRTIAAIGPDAIFADLDILAAAPGALVAAGFGDMLGKYTSLLDWRFGAAEGGEPYMEAVAELTKDALRQCVEAVGPIERRTPEGIRILIEALIQSGLAMLLFGQSHSASGAEHHLSHYWEMEYIKLGKRQLLHGAKVGVACGVIAELYRSLGEKGAEGLPFVKQPERLLEDLRELPSGDAIAGWLRRVGGPAAPGELGLPGGLLERSLKEAHQVRPNRCTLLRAYNEYRLS